MDNKNTSSGGLGICGVTFIVFLILKLCDVINWSWWWVTAPIWIPTVLFITICVVVFIVSFIIGAVKYIIKMKKGRE
jgi:uncharacterized protein (DUF983 family)